MTIKEFFKKDRFADLIGAELIEASEGYAKARLKVEERHLNGGDICQGGAVFTLADLGQINHADLLEDTAGMNRLFADIDMKVESSTERTLSTAQCAVYKTYHKMKKYSAFIAFCNVGDYMIQIDATSDENGAKAERALVKAGEVVSAAKHK